MSKRQKAVAKARERNAASTMCENLQIREFSKLPMRSAKCLVPRREGAFLSIQEYLDDLGAECRCDRAMAKSSGVAARFPKGDADSGFKA